MRPLARITRTCVANLSKCRMYSSASQEVTLQSLDGEEKGIRLLRLNRPETRNAISKNVANLLREMVDGLHSDREARVLIVQSDVPGAFCAGADLKERAGMAESDVPAFVRGLRCMLESFAELPLATIAALDGVAVGGGLEFALACDFRVAADTSKMGLVETKLGIIPGAGGTQRLPRLIGASRAKELIFTGRILDGAEAFDIGLVNKVVPQNEQKNAAALEALALAKEIVTSGPIAIECAKKAIDFGGQVDLKTGMTIEELCYARIVPTKDRIEGLMAFKEKRTPVFTGQ